MSGVRDRAAYLAYRAGADLARVLPHALGDPWARSFARAMVYAWPVKRAQVARHLVRASGGSLRGADLDRAVTAVFDNYGRYWHELFRLQDQPGASIDAHFDVEGFEHVERAACAGRGIIVALPHLGNYDYAGAWLARRGYPPLVVTEPVEPPELFDWFAATRRRLGMDVVALGADAGGTVLRALKANRVVCLVCDRDLSGDGVSVEFFGERTTLPAGPATLALRTGATLLPVGNYMLPRGGHLGRILAPLDTSRHARFRDDLARVTQDLAHRFEELIAAAPEQWLLMQPNWPSDGTRARCGNGARP
ncbi:MAG TPA: phosphatidylinositol mannoside acyltransferase [Acidimicrobiia bacterium]|nr:phosphatidylinositol mannoside acyltransferase [Acidimicrobiia bacterium]